MTVLKLSYEIFEKRSLEKRKKFEKELRTELSKWDSSYLKNVTANFIQYLNGEGTPEDFVQLILAAKFGGPIVLLPLVLGKSLSLIASIKHGTQIESP